MSGIFKKLHCLHLLEFLPNKDVECTFLGAANTRNWKTMLKGRVLAQSLCSIRAYKGESCAIKFQGRARPI